MERIVVQRHFPKANMPQLKRVAAYARVSSGKDAMLHSLSAQVSYYSNLIQNHSGWQYVGVYADEALTGTKDNRENFQRLLADCRAGMVDMVITKSISRFARNTVTLLETVRELKTMGVDNGNGIRIISKGVYADPSEYSDDLHILMVAENTSGRTLALHDIYDSLSVNDYMTAYSFYTKTIEDGACAMIDIRLWGYGLEDISITEASQIKSVEFSISIKDQNYKEIDEATLAFTIE